MGYSEMKKAVTDSMVQWDYRTMRFVYFFLVGMGVIGETGDGKRV